MLTDDRMRYASDDVPPFELVRVAAEGDPPVPEAFRGQLMVDTVHDGHIIPRRLLDARRVQLLEQDGTLWRQFVHERDWGADLVAEQLARSLGLAGYYRVNIARVVMDFNRFPGCSPPEPGPLERLAINEPFSSRLGYEEKRNLLVNFYDEISRGMERAIDGALIKLAIHTYDARNPTRTQRPELSLITRSNSYQLASRLPWGLFDPLFPDVLAESCARTILRDRVALTLEKAGFTVEHNFPYCFPDGSIEVRCQPWLFFSQLKRLFEAENGDLRERMAYRLVWQMLLNTNHRNAEGDALSGYLHSFRDPPPGREQQFRDARLAYEHITEYLARRPQLVSAYQRAPHRTSTMTIEVRKDLLWRFDGDTPVAPHERRARLVGETLAEAVVEYLREDLPAESTPAQAAAGPFEL